MPRTSQRDSRSERFMLTLVALALFMTGCGLPVRGSTSNPTDPPGISQHAAVQPKHWLITASGATLLMNTSAGKRFLQSIDAPATYEIIHSARGERDPLPQATHVEGFQSYQAIQAAFAQKQILPDVKAILYDNEHWPGTPAIEQQDPFTYVPLVQQLVHQHGLLFMNTPAADLSQVLAPNTKDQ